MRLNQGSDLVLSLSLLERSPGSRTPGSRAETEMHTGLQENQQWSAPEGLKWEPPMPEPTHPPTTGVETAHLSPADSWPCTDAEEV